jgi:hypothetical protein
LYYYWFAVADRFIVFLYSHDMGALYPDTSPFSRVTASRYWMTGLVASGTVLVLYTGINWLLGRLRPTYKPPDWKRVWVICAPGLLIGLPAITMSTNNPVLPAKHAAIVTMVALVGTGLALIPGKMAARQPAKLLWFAADGLGLAVMVLILISVERVGGWLERDGTKYIGMIAIFLALGIFLLAVLTGLTILLRRKSPSSVAMLVSGFAIAYLLLPLTHYVFCTNGYYYITDSDNFFAQHLSVQLGIWLLAWGIAYGVVKIRQKFVK